MSHAEPAPRRIEMPSLNDLEESGADDTQRVKDDLETWRRTRNIPPKNEMDEFRRKIALIREKQEREKKPKQ